LYSTNNRYGTVFDDWSRSVSSFAVDWYTFGYSVDWRSSDSRNKLALRHIKLYIGLGVEVNNVRGCVAD
jgi:hypothetical protein